MANHHLNTFDPLDLQFSVSNPDDGQDSQTGGSRPLQQAPSSAHHPSYLGFDNYPFTMMPQGDGLQLQSFGRPTAPPDLEGQMSNVMLAYNPNSSTGASMPVNLDASNAFAYDEATSMGVASQIVQSQFHPAFSTFPPTMPQHIAQYAQHSAPGGPPPGRKEPYNTSDNSLGSLEGSDFSCASDRSQMPPRATQQTQDRLQASGPGASYHAPHPVAIQPKKPSAAKSELAPAN